MSLSLAASARAGTIPRVLSIAGTDPTGGAGIHADLKSIAALGGYGMAVVTALVAQNSRGVRQIHLPPVEFLKAQLDAVSDDVTIDAVKLGMLHSLPVIEVVSQWLRRVNPPVVVLDPVMIATSGDRLLDEAAEAAIRQLCARVHLVTPNLPELAALAGEPEATTWEAAIAQAQRFATLAETAVLLKGGHLAGPDCPDALVTASDVVEVAGRRIATTNTHGTGCSYSAAMATLAGAGWSWEAALGRAKEWLTGAIEAGSALHVGGGNGPIDHHHELRHYLPEGRWSQRIWSESLPVREQIDACEFVVDLGSGALKPATFTWYLQQDAVYLGEFARQLARASASAPTDEEVAFWARGAATVIDVEAQLHRRHVGTELAAASPATTAYVAHLRASSSDSYAETIAAVLPCYWVYADVGHRLKQAASTPHPYQDWLDTYSAQEFADLTATVIEYVDTAARQASPTERARMESAFAAAMAHELAFFQAPYCRK